eukprot:jgi/Hompol1/1693/HPOL_002747-RA
MPLCNVARNPGDEPINISYNIYGSGPQHIVFLCGLGALGSFWDKSAAYFSSFPEYSVCLFDNRGIGGSSMPPGRYRLLDHLGWKRVHVVGLSLGGMIAQELALLLGDRVISLTLESTYAKFLGVPMLMLRLTLFGNGIDRDDLEARARFQPTVSFPKEWLLAPYKHQPEITNWDHVTAFYLERYRKYGIQDPKGHASQQAAGFLHYCDGRLRKIREQGYPVLVMAGDKDQVLLQPSSSIFLAKRLDARLEIYKGAGHLIYLQDPEWHDQMLLENFRKGWARLEKLVPADDLTIGTETPEASS